MARSPNFGERRGAARPSLVVLHYTAMDSAEAAIERLCDPVAEVSAHYLIGRDGSLASLVDEEMRAWHAGGGSWGAIDDVNSHSVGIELDNDGFQPFAEPLMRRLEALLGEILTRWSIRPEGVIAHSDMALGRKIDPGLRFDWRRLARQGLAIWPQVAVPEPADDRADAAGQARAFRAHALRLGYAPVETEVILSAFRLRFRPWKRTGPTDEADVALAADLARRFPAPDAVGD